MGDGINLLADEVLQPVGSCVDADVPNPFCRVYATLSISQGTFSGGILFVQLCDDFEGIVHTLVWIHGAGTDGSEVGRAIKAKDVESFVSRDSDELAPITPVDL